MLHLLSRCRAGDLVGARIESILLIAATKVGLCGRDIAAECIQIRQRYRLSVWAPLAFLEFIIYLRPHNVRFCGPIGVLSLV